METSANDLMRKLLHNELQLLGAIDGTKAYAGPKEVSIDPTNMCNNNCIACWNRSPLLGDLEKNDEWKRQTLSLELLESLIDELARMGVEKILLSGGGEPFMHPDILKIVELVKSHHIFCEINTNGTLIEQFKARRLFELGLDHLVISLWAGSIKGYVEVHPNKTEETFYRIKEMLLLLDTLKRKNKTDLPEVKLHHVILNRNYNRIEEMVDFALQTHANSLDFQLLDPIPGATDRLLLSQGQIKELVKNLNRALGKVERLNLCFNNIQQTIDRIQARSALAGRYDQAEVDKVPCYVGWYIARILANGDVVPGFCGTELPMGNLYQWSFEEIWFSPDFNEFRKKAKTLKKSNPYFEKTYCIKTCEHLNLNKEVHKKALWLSPTLLKGIPPPLCYPKGLFTDGQIKRILMLDINDKPHIDYCVYIFHRQLPHIWRKNAVGPPRISVLSNIQGVLENPDVNETIIFQRRKRINLVSTLRLLYQLRIKRFNLIVILVDRIDQKVDPRVQLLALFCGTAYKLKFDPLGNTIFSPNTIWKIGSIRLKGWVKENIQKSCSFLFKASFLILTTIFLSVLVCTKKIYLKLRKA